jgi:hypothetical protein
MGVEAVLAAFPFCGLSATCPFISVEKNDIKKIIKIKRVEEFTCAFVLILIVLLR